tara:strand:+ start:870 stop:1262 length:393 start_codon:yes stop_codon:yes gene_type:complete
MGIKKEYLTWMYVDRLTDIIASQIKLNFKNVDSIYGIPRGGLIPAVMLSHKLGLPYSDKLTLTSLIVDDISDTGVTLKEFEGYNTAVLLHKPHTSESVPTIYGESYQKDDWVVFPWEREDSETIQDYLAN